MKFAITLQTEVEAETENEAYQKAEAAKRAADQYVNVVSIERAEVVD